MFSVWATGLPGGRNRIWDEGDRSQREGERWLYFEVPSEAPDRGILLKGTQVSGVGGRGSEDLRVWMRTQSGTPGGGGGGAGSTSKEEEDGRGAAKET